MKWEPINLMTWQQYLTYLAAQQKLKQIKKILRGEE